VKQITGLWPCFHCNGKLQARINLRIEVASFNNPRIFIYIGVALPVKTCVQVMIGSDLSWVFGYFKYVVVLQNLFSYLFYVLII
jgi:hypothetical protein